MDLEPRALDLIDRIYGAVCDPAHWQSVADALSRAFEDSPTAIGFGLSGPRATQHHFTAGLPGAFGPAFAEHFATGLPAREGAMALFTERFRTGDAAFSDLELEETGLYRDWMVPTGLAPIWPLVHVVARDGAAPVVVAILRRSGAPPFSKAEFALANRLVPHFARALDLYAEFSASHRDRRALEEVIDRLRVGVILVNADGRALRWNPSANAMLDDGNAIRLVDDCVHARDRDGEQALRAALRDAAQSGATHAFQLCANGSASRSIRVVANPLSGVPPGNPAREAVVALLLAGPEVISERSLRPLQSRHALTEAETELVALLSRGASIEQAAAQRGVSLNTARSQLKQVFAKTETRRQSDLLRLVFTGLPPTVDD